MHGYGVSCCVQSDEQEDTSQHEASAIEGDLDSVEAALSMVVYLTSLSICYRTIYTYAQFSSGKTNLGISRRGKSCLPRRTRWNSRIKTHLFPGVWLAEDDSIQGTQVEDTDKDQYFILQDAGRNEN